MVTVVTSLLSWLMSSPLPPFICKMSPDVCLKILFFITTSPHITAFVVCLRWNSCGSSMTPSQVKKDILPQNVSSKSTQTSVPLYCCFCTDLFSVLLCFFRLSVISPWLKRWVPTLVHTTWISILLLIQRILGRPASRSPLTAMNPLN